MTLWLVAVIPTLCPAFVRVQIIRAPMCVFPAPGGPWALNFRLDQEHQLAVTAIKEDLAFQLQTGNMSRAPYDLLKLQYLYQSKRIAAAALALPTRDAAKIIGDNLANAERVCRELKLFDRVITVPIIVVAFQ
jgi:hypothetical protein